MADIATVQFPTMKPRYLVYKCFASLLILASMACGKTEWPQSPRVAVSASTNQSPKPTSMDVACNTWYQSNPDIFYHTMEGVLSQMNTSNSKGIQVYAIRNGMAFIIDNSLPRYLNYSVWYDVSGNDITIYIRDSHQSVTTNMALTVRIVVI